MSEWHLITCEYPPRVGGVSHYTELVASELARAGDSVHVWCPSSNGKTPDASGVVVHRDLGNVSPRDLCRVGQLLNQFPAPRRLFVQWVPHGYGYQSLNLPFCLWLWKRRVFHQDRVEIMVHEPYLGLEGSWRQRAAALVHRLMALILVGAASRIWVANPTWGKFWRGYAWGRKVPFDWLPVPSTVPVVQDPRRISEIRSRYVPREGFLLGHFGTYGRPIKNSLMNLLPRLLLSHRQWLVLLLGRGNNYFRDEFIKTHPSLAAQVFAPGILSQVELSQHLSACDLMIQPYPKGVNGRQTSVMAALAHGKPVVTTRGRFTESVWIETRAVGLVPPENPAAVIELVERVLTDESERKRMGTAAKKLYEDYFDIRHTIRALREEKRG